MPRISVRNSADALLSRAARESTFYGRQPGFGQIFEVK